MRNIWNHLRRNATMGLFAGITAGLFLLAVLSFAWPGSPGQAAPDSFGPFAGPGWPFPFVPGWIALAAFALNLGGLLLAAGFGLAAVFKRRDEANSR